MNNVYELHNVLTKATIRCTSDYLNSWLARGFSVEKIFTEVDKNKLQHVLEGGSPNGEYGLSSSNI
jgi:hypothetical protein